VVFIVIIAITVATSGAAGIGFLGSNFAVGSALGFSGLAATIVGAVANAVAAMIIMQAIDLIATKAFGAKIGAIIATIASIVAMQVGSSLMTGQSMASAWGNLMSAHNIINMTSAVGNGVAGYLKAGSMDFTKQTEELLKQYNDNTKAMTQKFIDTFGYGKTYFDPTLLTDFEMSRLNSMESLSGFLQRTLMTGTDIAQMTMDMLTHFPDLTLDTNIAK
jgi:hypothetical protein